MFFARSDAEHIAEAVLAFEEMEGRFSPRAARRQAERFGREGFKKKAAERFVRGLREHRERIEKFAEGG